MADVGARDMPTGAIESVHFLMTSSYFQGLFDDRLVYS